MSTPNEAFPAQARTQESPATAGNIAMMPDMTAHTPAHARSQESILDRLTDGQKRMLRAAIAFVVIDMCGGFWLSYQNLSHAAAQHGWRTPWVLPLIIDAGIPTYIIIDYLLVALGCRSWLARSIAWLFALLTVYLNGAVTATTSLPWRIAAMAAPSAWVLGIEVIRLLWRVLARGEITRREGIPIERWLANPFTAVALARRKALLGVTSRAVMSAIEDARVFLRDAVAAVRVKRPDLPVPLSVARAMRTGRFPGEVRAAIEQGVKNGSGAVTWEPVMAGWLTGRMGLSETLAEAISNPRENQAGDHAQAAPEPLLAAAPGPLPKRSSAPAPKSRRSAPVSDDTQDMTTELRALQMLDAHPELREKGQGSELARRLGVHPSYGRKLHSRLTEEERPAEALQERSSPPLQEQDERAAGAPSAGAVEHPSGSGDD